MTRKEFPAKRIESEAEISDLIRADEWRMNVLRVAEKKALPDWWIGAGFLRNLIWDALEGNDPERPRDIDLVYFDSTVIDPETDWKYDRDMEGIFPGAEWEVRNQARMHYVNNLEPYSSTADGIAHWVETATCVAVKLEEGKLRYLFCHGTDDLYNLVARPTETFKTKELLPTFYERVEKKIGKIDGRICELRMSNFLRCYVIDGWRAMVRA